MVYINLAPIMIVFAKNLARQLAFRQMPKLIAIDAPPSNSIPTLIKQIWDKGDTALVLDYKLRSKLKEFLVKSVKPHALIDANLEQIHLKEGIPTLAGDALVVFTSGTGSVQKAAILTHENLKASADACFKALDVDTNSDSLIACLPLGHIGGLSVVIRSLLWSIPVEVLGAFEGSLLQTLARDGNRIISAVPTMLREIDTSLFKKILVGAMPNNITASNIISTYGMTETAAAISYNGILNDNIEAKLDDAGCLVIRGPQLLRAYRSRHSKVSEEGYDPKDNEGWFKTGDLAQLQGNNIKILGRIDNVINTGGLKVNPELVEAIIKQNSAVKEVAVVGLPDKKWGQAVTALIVLSKKGNLKEDELNAEIKEKLSYWAVPKKYVYLKSLPKTALGKIRRRELSELIQKQVLS
jgi:O-succinylbenzoic acid--CoA ligase